MGVVLGLAASCGVDDGSVDEPTITAAGTGQGLGTSTAQSDLTDDSASDAVCTRGRYRCHARIRGAGGDRRLRPHALVPTGIGALDLQAAYNIVPDKIVGTKPTVAIVDAYGYPNLESDLATYRSYYKLPPCTVANGCLKIVNAAGDTSPLPPPPPPDDDWTIETALDMDMVSAACPLCNLLIVQGDDSGVSLLFSQDAAAALGATVISNSWGGPEAVDTTPEQLAATESFFQRPTIGIFVSAGDDGYNDGGEGPDYPATSAGVVAVGGTRLVKDATTPRGWTETAWSKGGSACSLRVGKPAHQTLSPCPFKATADIAAVGDPDTGLAVFNAANSGWIIVGGTSASAPFVAGIFAATGNGAASGASIATQTAKLHDVTVGSNGMCASEGNLLCNAAVGWDGPTGYGTPDAAALGGIVVPPTGGGEPEATEGDLTGGCSIGGGGGGGGHGAGVAGMLGLALIGVRRRRR